MQLRPFKNNELIKPSFFQKLFGLPVKKNALIELNNALAAAEKAENISLEDVEKISQNYKASLASMFSEERQQMLADYISFALEDKHLSDDEKKSIFHLKRILFIDDKTANSLIKSSAERTYRKVFDKVISDNAISAEEKEFLASLEANLALDDTSVDRIRKEMTKARYEAFLQNAISDERLSPDEDAELKRIAENLNLTISFDNATKDALDRFRLYWQIENGELPEVDTGIRLQRNEKCYFTTPCEWHENRTRTRRINYGGPTARIRIMKGIYWSAGSLGINRVREEYLQHIDSGELFLTNKRIIFMGSRQNKTLRHNRILDFELYSNGVTLQKDRGKNPFLEFTSNVDLFGMLFSRVLDNV